MDTVLRYRGGRNRETLATFQVQILQDDVEEPSEEFFLRVIPVQNVVILTPVITVRILGTGM